MKLVMWIALITAACGKSDPRPVTNATAPIVDGVQMLSIGSANASRLRYQLAKGTRSLLEMSMGLDMDAGGRGGKMPLLVLTLEIVIEDVLPDGTAQIKTTITDARPKERPGSVMPSPVMGEMTRSLVGIGFSAKLSPTGKLSEAHADAKNLPAPLAAQIGELTQSLEQLAMPLPDEPVGVGAKWSTRKTAAQNGLELLTLTTIELTAIDGPRVTFTSTSTISAKDQTMKQGDIEVSIKDVGGGGTSKGTIDLTKMTLVGQFDLEFRGTMSAKGQTAPMKMTMTMTTSVPAPQGAQSAP